MNIFVVVYWRGLYEFLNKMFRPIRRKSICVGYVPTRELADDLLSRLDRRLCTELRTKRELPNATVVSRWNNCLEITINAWRTLEPGLALLVADIYEEVAEEVKAVAAAEEVEIE